MKRIREENINTKEHWNDRYSRGKIHNRAFLYKFLLDYISPAVNNMRGKTWADVACGTGEGARLLKLYNPALEVSGYDISDVMMSYNREKYPEIFWGVCDLYKDLEPQMPKFDFISIIETLEHLEKPFEIVDRLLANVNTALYISVPHRENPETSQELEHVTSFEVQDFLDRYNNINILDEIGYLRLILFAK